MNIYLKWLLIVGLNSVAGFFWGAGLEKGIEHWAGMIAGVATWYFAYLALDSYLHQIGRLDISRRLVISTSLRIPLQLTLYPDMIAGMVAIWTCEELLGLGRGFSQFVFSYSLTFFTGLYLGIICAVLYGLVSAVIYLRNIRGRSQQASPT
jgi:hypothetical protein